MNVFVVGGTGFIGSRVVQALCGHEVTVFHRGEGCRGSADARHVHGDRRDLASFRDTIRALRPDVVLDMTSGNGAEAERVTRSLADLVPRFVAVSSISVYRMFGVLLRTETAPVRGSPASEAAPLRSSLFPYRGRAPRAADDPRRWLDDYDKIPVERAFLEQTAACSIVRLPMVYGPGDPDDRCAGYLRWMRDGRPSIPLRESVARWRNARCYVENVAAAIARVVESGAPGAIYNVAEPHDFSEAEWVLHIGATVGWDGAVRLVPDESPLGGPTVDELPEDADFEQHLRMDTSRIRRELSFTEPVTLEEALRRTVCDAGRSPRALGPGAADAPPVPTERCRGTP